MTGKVDRASRDGSGTNRVAHLLEGSSGIGATLALCAAFGSAACAGHQEGASATGDEAAANQLLQRARENPSPERYHRVLEQFASTHASGIARSELATLLVARARSLLDARDFHGADEAAEEARIYGNEEQTRAAVALLDSVDEGRALQIAEQATSLASTENGCVPALAMVFQPLSEKPRPRPRFTEALRAHTAKALGECVRAELVSRFHAGDEPNARLLLATPQVTVDLPREAYAEVVLALTELVVEKTLHQIAPLIVDHKWADALAEVARQKDDGVLETGEAEAAVAALREKLRADLIQRIETARASPRPSRDAPAIRDLASLAGWNPVPEDVARGLTELSRALECERLHCTLSKPAAVFAWGALPLSPPDAAEGPASGSHLEHGQPVFRVAIAGTRALVTTTDPGTLSGAGLLDQAAGWVDASRLRPAPTADWLPPPDLLAGVRVWGPLREGVHEYSLGVVASADSKHAVVRRLADSLDITVDTQLLRYGTVPLGLKVLAFCVDRIHAEPAKIDGAIVKERDVEKVPVVCERGSLAQVEMLSALTADPAWLPPKKP